MSENDSRFYLPDKDDGKGQFRTIKVWENTYQKLLTLKSKLAVLDGNNVSMAQVVEGLWTTFEVEVDNIVLSDD